MAGQLASLVRAVAGVAPARTAGAHSNRPMPRRLRVYVGGVAAAFALALTFAFTAAPPRISAHALGSAAGLAVLVAAARAFPIRLAPKRKMSVDTAPSFAAVVLLSPALAIATAAAGMLAGELRSHSRWFQATFNTAVAGLRVGAGALVYRAAADIPLRSAEAARISPLALVLAAAALYLISSVLVDTAAGLTLGQNPFKDWWMVQRRKLPHEGVLLLLGLFAALPARDYPWLLPVLIVPAAIVRRSLQEGVQIKSETREALESLAEAVDLRHQRSADHSRRVAELSRVIARRMGLPSGQIDLIVDAARLRDIGEVALPPDLLVKAGPLTEEEREELKRHSITGASMVERFADFEACAALIRHHHERWDGWGAPEGRTGDAIPLGARIIAVAERYEALIAPRPYREALAPARAREELRRGAGTQLDPGIVNVLLEILGDGQPEQRAVDALSAVLPGTFRTGLGVPGGGP